MTKKNNANTDTLRKNFEQKIRKTQTCWLWTGKCRKDGYGVMCVNYKARRAHRLSYEMEHGVSLTPHQKVLHACDTPRCVNPSHLVLGTQTDNMRDMMNKRRNIWMYAGADHPRARFTLNQAQRIRNLVAQGKSQREIAQKFACAQQTVSKIVRYIRYA